METANGNSTAKNKSHANYREAKRVLQRRTRQLKDEWWKKKAEEIQEMHDKHDARGVFKAIKRICGPTIRTSQTVKSKDDTILDQPEEVLARWTEHFEQLLNQQSEVDETVIDNIAQRDTDFSMENPPSYTEVTDAIKKLKNNRCAGEDGVPAEIFKFAGDAFKKKLHKLVMQVWDIADVPQGWKNALIIKLYKKGDTLNCGNYRGISLLAVAGKILSNILLVRMENLLSDILPESQCGFRRERSTVDMIFSLNQIQEKCKEQNLDIYMVFIDLTKAYDTVNRRMLWKILAKLGIPGKVVKIIQNMHDGMKGKLSIEVGMSELFDIKNGLRQGCVLAPYLFNLYFAMVMAEAFRGIPDEAGVQINYKIEERLFDLRRLRTKQIQKECIRDLCYADDCGLIAHSLEHVQHLMSAVNVATKKYGLSVSIKKTEIMKQRVDEEQREETEGQEKSVMVDGVALKVVKDFPYLGCMLSNDTSLDREISARLRKAGTAFGKLWHRVWKPKGISMKTKIAIYRACVLSILLYGCQSWNTYKRHIQQLETFHHRCLRKIIGIPWQALVPTTEVLDRAEMPFIETMVRKARLKWLGHVRRMPNHRYPKMILFSEMSKGKRKQRKPRQRWKDIVKADLRAFGMKVTKWWLDSSRENKAGWRRKIFDGANSYNDAKRNTAIEKRLQRKKKETNQRKPTGNFECGVDGCKKAFAQASSRNRHIRSHHPKAINLKCPMCPKVCSNQSGLTRHQRIHKEKDKA